VQFVARLAIGISNKADAVKNPHTMRIPACILSS
jgi:hypothetical protein